MTDNADIAAELKALKERVAELEKTCKSGKRAKRAPSAANKWVGEWMKKNKGKIPQEKIMKAAWEAYHAQK